MALVKLDAKSRPVSVLVVPAATDGTAGSTVGAGMADAGGSGGSGDEIEIPGMLKDM